jgi:hypothetical protein
MHRARNGVTPSEAKQSRGAPLPVYDAPAPHLAEAKRLRLLKLATKATV